jgi:hypothetical protein
MYNIILESRNVLEESSLQTPWSWEYRFRMKVHDEHPHTVNYCTLCQLPLKLNFTPELKTVFFTFENELSLAACLINLYSKRKKTHVVMF